MTFPHVQEVAGEVNRIGRALKWELVPKDQRNDRENSGGIERFLYACLRNRQRKAMPQSLPRYKGKARGKTSHPFEVGYSLWQQNSRVTHLIAQDVYPLKLGDVHGRRMSRILYGDFERRLSAILIKRYLGGNKVSFEPSSIKNALVLSLRSLNAGLLVHDSGLRLHDSCLSQKDNYLHTTRSENGESQYGLRYAGEFPVPEKGPRDFVAAILWFAVFYVVGMRTCSLRMRYPWLSLVGLCMLIAAFAGGYLIILHADSFF